MLNEDYKDMLLALSEERVRFLLEGMVPFCRPRAHSAGRASSLTGGWKLRGV